jgi:GT2 family glycosyltransferase
LIDFLKSHPDSAVCGPRILYPDGSLQVSFYSFPSLAKKFLKVIGVNKIMSRKPGLLKKMLRFRKLMPGYMSMFNSNFENIDENMEVPWVTGACLVVKSDYFQRVGLFDENFRMYCEDMDLCLRMHEEGLKVFFIPEARIIHHRGWMNRSRQSLDFYFNSHSYYYKKNFRGIYKSMLLFLNSFERTYERFFLYLRNRSSRT